MRVERRKFQRYCLKDSAVAVIKAEPIKLFPILDISLGGLGISANGSIEQLTEFSSLEILLDDCSFYLDSLFYVPLPESRNLHWNPAAALQDRFCGLKFVDLMPSQKTHLKQFIRKHTRGGKTPQFIRKLIQFFHQTFNKKQLSNSCQNIWPYRSTL